MIGAMIGEMIAGIGPLATWVIILGVLPAAVLFAAMWSIGRLADLGTDLRLAIRRRRFPRPDA